MENSTLVFGQGHAPGLKAAASLNSPNTLVLTALSATAHGEYALLRRVGHAFNQSAIVQFQMPRPGDIHGWVNPLNCATVTRFRRANIAAVSVPGTAAGDEAEIAGVLARRLNLAHGTLKGVLLFVDARAMNMHRFLHAFDAELSPAASVIGAANRQSSDFAPVTTLAGRNIADHAALAIGLYGAISMEVGMTTGFQPLPGEWTVTRAHGDAILELDGLPALPEYLKAIERSGLTGSRGAFPLLVHNRPMGTASYSRCIVGVNARASALMLSHAIDEGFKVCLMHSNAERILAAVDQAEAAAAARFRKQTIPALRIAMSCVNRREQLGPRFDEERELVRTNMRSGQGLADFYSDGVIARQPGGGCQVHCQAMGLALIGEDRLV